MAKGNASPVMGLSRLGMYHNMPAMGAGQQMPMGPSPNAISGMLSRYVGGTNFPQTGGITGYYAPGTAAGGATGMMGGHPLPAGSLLGNAATNMQPNNLNDLLTKFSNQGNMNRSL